MTKLSDYQSYEEAKVRLDQIVTDVRAKDISLETSLELLEEGVALANKCTELIDVASWSVPGADDEGEAAIAATSEGGFIVDVDPAATTEFSPVGSGHVAGNTDAVNEKADEAVDSLNTKDRVG